MKKTLLFAAVLCGLSSFAVEPVAVWNGDLADGTKNGITMSLRSADVSANVAAYNDGAVNLTKNTNKGSQGVILSWASGTYTEKEMTVFVRYSGLAHDNGNTSLLSVLWGATDKEFVSSTNGGRTGVGLACNVTTATVTNWPVDRNTAYVVPNEGIMMVSYSGVSANKGVRLAFAAKSGGAYGAFTQAYYYTGDMCVVDGVFNGIKIGGTIASTGGFYRPTMNIDAVSIFAQSTTMEEAEALKNDAFDEVKSYKVGDTVVWKNTGTDNATASTTDSPITEANFNICIPATKELPAGAVVRITKVRLASINTTFQSWTDRKSDCSLINIIGIRSNGANGCTVNANNPARFLDDTAEDAYIDSSVTQSDHALNFTFSSNVDLTVGETYAGDSNNSNAHGLALCHHNGNLCYGSNHDWTAIRYVTSNDANSIFVNPAAAANGNYPVYEVTATVVSLPSDSITVQLEGEKSWEDFQTDGKSKVIVNVVGDATLTLNSARSENIVFTGSGNLTVKNAQHLVWANVTDSDVGSVTYEIGGAYTAPAGLLNKIKAASTKYKFIFTGNATVDFTPANLGTINTHLVFSGDTSTLKITNGNNKFAASATYDNPTILVERGTLTFYGHDVTGWAAGTDANGIIRVKNGATLQLENHGTGTFYYSQRIAIDAGATVNVGKSLSDNQFRMTEGVNGQQIWVQDCASDMTATPAKLVLADGQLALAKDGSAQGIGVYVGQNAKLQITGTINSMNNAGTQAVDNSFARPIRKTGAGLLEVSGTHGATYEVAAGSIGGNATVQKLNLASGTSLVLDDNKSLIVQTALTLANPINLICEPQHGMTVLTPPSDFEGTGYKTTLNGETNEFDLYMEDGALKLKYKTPPAFPEDIGDFVIEVKDGKVGEITIDVSNLDLHDYVTDSGIKYKLDFGGDKVVVGTRTENSVIFDLATGDFLSEHVYRGDFVVEFPDGELKNPIAIYEGVRTPTWISSELIIRKQGTINDAQGETIKLEEESILNHDPDYIDNCDSVYMVTLSASEAVESDSDDELKGDEQGGLRLVKADETTVKLEYLYNDESDNTVKWGDEWPDGTKTGTVTLAVNDSVTVRVEFHYAKGEEGDTSYVKYSIGEAYERSVTSWATEKKVTEVFIADGTCLPDDLTGLFQFDSAVVVDIELRPGEGDAIDYNTEAEANAALETLKVGICDAVRNVLTTTEAQDTYRSYFRLVVVPSTTLEGGYSVKTEFTTDAQTMIEEELEEELEKIVEAFNAVDGKAEIAAKPGLYYGVKRGETLEAMEVKEDLQMAGADGKVMLTITKPEGAAAHFYRIICSPTPATK